MPRREKIVMKKHGETENGLQRCLGLFPVVNIVIANMIGTGIFTTSGLPACALFMNMKKRRGQ